MDIRNIVFVVAISLRVYAPSIHRWHTICRHVEHIHSCRLLKFMWARYLFSSSYFSFHFEEERSMYFVFHSSFFVLLVFGWLFGCATSNCVYFFLFSISSSAASASWMHRSRWFATQIRLCVVGWGCAAYSAYACVCEFAFVWQIVGSPLFSGSVCTCKIDVCIKQINDINLKTIFGSFTFKRLHLPYMRVADGWWWIWVEVNGLSNTSCLSWHIRATPVYRRIRPAIGKMVYPQPHRINGKEIISLRCLRFSLYLTLKPRYQEIGKKGEKGMANEIRMGRMRVDELDG